MKKMKKRKWSVDLQTLYYFARKTKRWSHEKFVEKKNVSEKAAKRLLEEWKKKIETAHEK